MGSTIVLSKKLQKAWTEDKVDSKSSEIFGSQQLFPGLSYLVNHYIGSPSYELANLPIYFVNGSTDNVTESMQETIMAMSLMGVRYVQVFNEETLPAGVFESDLIGF